MKKYIIFTAVILLLVINLLLGYFYYLGKHNSNTNDKIVKKDKQGVSGEVRRINVLSLKGWDQFPNVSRSNDSFVITMMGSTEVMFVNTNDGIDIPIGKDFTILIDMGISPAVDIKRDTVSGSVLLQNGSSNEESRVEVGYDEKGMLKVDYFAPTPDRKLHVDNLVKNVSSTSNKLRIEVVRKDDNELWSFYDNSTNKLLTKDVKLPKPFLSQVENKINFGFYPRSVSPNGATMIVKQLDVLIK